MSVFSKSVRDYLLVRLEKKTDDEMILAGHKIFLYDGKESISDGQMQTYNPNDRIRIYGEVVALPESLSSDAMDYSRMQLKDVVMDIKLGDKAYFYYIELNDNNIVHYEGQMYLRLRYDKVICVVRDGDILPVTGHILAFPVKESVTFLAYTSESIKNLEMDVRYVSKPYHDEIDEIAPNKKYYVEPSCEFLNNIEGVDYMCFRREYITGSV